MVWCLQKVHGRESKVGAGLSYVPGLRRNSGWDHIGSRTTYVTRDTRRLTKHSLLVAIFACSASCWQQARSRHQGPADEGW